jgi:hypothetical protein
MACSFATRAAGASRYLTREGARAASAARSRTKVIAGAKRLREDLFEPADCEILTISAMVNQRARRPGSDDPARRPAPLAMTAAPAGAGCGPARSTERLSPYADGQPRGNTRYRVKEPTRP